MEFSVGDKVIHPQFGPGQITGIAGSEPPDAEQRYYVIEIPRKGLIVHTPVGMAGTLGVRLAMSASRSRRILGMLGGKPHPLPDEFRARQEQVAQMLDTGQVAQLAAVVRDLTWRQKSDHLTKKDADLLRKALDLLAAEMALVSGDSVSEVRDLIGTTLSAAMASAGK
jgi:CarD family transcriptional regulator